MRARNSESSGWTWGMVALAGLVPFASDMLRNFQLFAPEQLVWSFAAILAATSAVFALVALVVRLTRVEGRWARVTFACTAALVLSVFLYDSNMTELRLGFGLSRMTAATAVAVLFGIYWTVAAGLGAKWTSLLLAGLLAFRLMQAGAAISDSTVQGDELVSAEEIEIYDRVKLARTPNIYFICLESYHGFGAMRELYGFDNADFQEFLEQNEFSVAEDTLSNYSFTMTSLQSFLQMGHHYAAGAFGNHDSLYARGFVSGSSTYYNPVLNILKHNGYSIVYLLPSDYYYRPGAGMVDVSLLDRSWPLAPLKVSLPRFIGREPDTCVEDFEQKVGQTIAAWPPGKPAFFFAKLGAEHSAHDYDYRTDREAFIGRYVKAVSEANPGIETLCRQIIARDPQGIILLAGDHGAQSYKAGNQGYRETMHVDGIPAERLVRDIHDVLLAIRWGEGMEPMPYPCRSLANVMRFVFFRLSGDEELWNTATHDSAYFLGKGGLFLTAEDGQPLPEWTFVPRKGWQ